MVGCVERLRAGPKGLNLISFSASSGTVLCIIAELQLYRAILEKKKRIRCSIWDTKMEQIGFDPSFKQREWGKLSHRGATELPRGKEPCWRSHP